MSSVDEVRVLEPPTTEPIAIVGMGCRLPGGIGSPREMWDFLLAKGVSAGPLPAGRWNEYRTSDSQVNRALDGVTRSGSFLDDVSRFDAEFFRVSPREAELMDPQQRIVLETVWEALEHAGVVPSSLAGTDVGVYMGVGSDDYGRWLLQDPAGVEAWMGVGSSQCGVANRVSYCFDLRGASMSVDTACSSSLVAVHLACQALRGGESQLAIVGGVNIMAGPGLSLVLDAAGAVAQDGRSKSFDEAADGYGRGEGAGVLVLQPLSAAQRDGRRIHAVIRGSAVHQDGRTNGIMAPSADAQEHLLRRTYIAAGVDPNTIDYIEAHGTGTPTGDPIEAKAMAAVLGIGREATRPCLIGSAKANVGHLEAGAGLVGMIKATLALQKGLIPAQPGVTPSTSIPWKEYGLRVVQEHEVWPASSKIRRAGVSAYGYGGTLAHVVLEQAPVHELDDSIDEQNMDTAFMLPLSAPNPRGLSSVVQLLAANLEHGEHSLRKLAMSLTSHREHHSARAAVVAGSISALRERLDSISQDNIHESVAIGTASKSPLDPVWVFSGHGSQWANMGVELLEKSSIFGAVIDDIDIIYKEELGVTARTALQNGDFSDTYLAQPMIYAMQVGLAAVWRNEGLRPAAVIGHSVGEIAAAVTAGILDLAAGARLICRRSLLLRKVAGDGAMLFVNRSFEELATFFPSESEVSPAIFTSPGSAILAGTSKGIERAEALLADKGLVTRRVASDVAFHSAQMDPLLDELRSSIAEIEPKENHLPVYTTALTDPRSDARRTADYWAQNLRNPVRFMQAVSAALDDGYRAFIEISSHPVVREAIEDIVDSHSATMCVVAHSMRRNRGARHELLTNKANLYVNGVLFDWPETGVFGDCSADLPTYPWSKSPYWYPGRGSRITSCSRHDPSSHSLLGAYQDVHELSDLRLWSTTLDHETRPYPGLHEIHGTEVVPAAVLVNTLLGVADDASVAKRLRDVRFRAPLTTSRQLDVQISQSGDDVHIASRPRGDADTQRFSWTRNASARIESGGSDLAKSIDLEFMQESYPLAAGADYVIQKLAAVGVLSTGFTWKATRLHVGEDGILATVDADPGTQRSWAPVLDAALSIGAALVGDGSTLKMATAIQDLTLMGDPPRHIVVSGKTRSATPDTVDMVIATVDGSVLGVLGGLEYRSPDRMVEGEAVDTKLIQELTWRGVKPADRARKGRRRLDRIIIIGDADWAERVLSVSPIEVELIATAADLPDDINDRTAILVVPRHEGEIVTSSRSSAWSLVATVGEVARRSPVRHPRVWAVTKGVRNAQTLDAVASASMWGTARVVANEHPQLWGGIIDIPAEVSDQDVTQLVDVLALQPALDVVSIRDSAYEEAQLEYVSHSGKPHRWSCRQDGTYVVTGGLGALGRRVARQMARRGAGAVVLVGRGGARGKPADGDDVTLEDISGHNSGGESATTVVRVVTSDVADHACFASDLRDALKGLPPVRGVVHAAGVLDNRVVLDVDEESLEAVMRPKASGAYTLHRMFPPGALDFLVLFSSCGPLLGLTGQATYAAANAFLDSLATHRRMLGDNTISISWTSWRGLGMSTSSAVIDSELSAYGAADITEDEAFEAWDTISGLDRAHVTAIRFTDVDTAVQLPLLARIGTRDEKPTQSVSDLSHDQILLEVRAHIARETRMEIADVTDCFPLGELGLDSVMTLTIRRALERTFHVRLPASVMWDDPTADSIASQIEIHLLG
ncbi:type I polyketide synthase [Nocardia salmonicida]|uniref:type I polyketide synthase n=1 Tax=Nocardia salmonicida TaxID=53431 RepID=UPI0037B5499B